MANQPFWQGKQIRTRIQGGPKVAQHPFLGDNQNHILKTIQSADVLNSQFSTKCSDELICTHFEERPPIGWFWKPQFNSDY